MSVRPSTLAKYDLDHDRAHNLVNQITDITEQDDPQQEQWATPVWSARGKTSFGDAGSSAETLVH